MPCDEINFALVVNSEASAARGERAFVGQRRRHRVTRKLLPVLAIARADQDEFPVHRITQREAFLFGDAHQRVEKELRVRAGKFKLPRVAAVVRLVDARQFSRPAGHHVRDLLIERLHSAQIERCAGIDDKPRIVLAPII